MNRAKTDKANAVRKEFGLMVIRRPSIASWLTKNKGGKWTYDHHATWWCDDGIRHVSRVAMDATEEDGAYGYHLYGGDDPGWLFGL